MRRQQTRPVVIPLGEPMVILAAVCALVAACAGMYHLIVWMLG